MVKLNLLISSQVSSQVSSKAIHLPLSCLIVVIDYIMRISVNTMKENGLLHLRYLMSRGKKRVGESHNNVKLY